MKKEFKTIEYTTCGIKELSESDTMLIEYARSSCDSSYAPHSNFNVGVAAILDNGEIVTASNQESDVLPCGMCAERVLLFSIKAQHSEHEIKSLAIAAKRDGELISKEIYPCGACTQTLIDVEKRQKQHIKLILTGKDSCVIIESAHLLLPFEFSLDV